MPSVTQSIRSKLNLLFLGAPGAGKGTYATRLSKKWDIPHVSTGDIIRSEIKRGSTLGNEFKRFSDSGDLVPDDLVVEIVRKRLSEADTFRGYILDGFPRTVYQADKLSGFAAPNLCLNLALPNEYLIMKLAGRRVCTTCGANYNVADIRNGEYDMPPLLPKPDKSSTCQCSDLVQRDDDKEDVVAARLKTYDEVTAPLIEYYREKGLLLTFDVKKGVKDVDLIEQRILETLRK